MLIYNLMKKFNNNSDIDYSSDGYICQLLSIKQIFVYYAKTRINLIFKRLSFIKLIKTLILICNFNYK